MHYEGRNLDSLSPEELENLEKILQGSLNKIDDTLNLLSNEQT